MLKFILASLTFHFLLFATFILSSRFSSQKLNIQTGEPLEVQLIRGEQKKSTSLKKIKLKKVFKLHTIKTIGDNLNVVNKLRGIDTEREVIGSLRPTYPLSSRKLKEEGVTKIKIMIDAYGRITDYVVTRSSGYRRLDQAAITAMKEVRFKPLKIKSKNITSSQELVFDFQLNKRSSIL